MTAPLRPNNLEAFWMPFTANRQFKQNPRLLVAAKGMYYTSEDGRQILDGTAGLWCVNAGHGREKIVEAVAAQVTELDYAPAFQMGHPKAFELAATPGRHDAVAARPCLLHQFRLGSRSIRRSRSRSPITAPAARASKFRLLGRERGYHGVSFGGISVGGIVRATARPSARSLTGVDHIRHTHDLARNAFSRGEPEYGAEFADDLEKRHRAA